jgi:hypothetical protein
VPNRLNFIAAAWHRLRSARQAALRRAGARAVVVIAGLLALPVLPAAAADIPDLLIFQGNLSARTQLLLQNRSHVQATPFDGLVVNIPASWDGTLKTTTLDYRTVHDWLQPLAGTLPKIKRSYLLMVVRDMGDPFDDWTQLINNWLILARAARSVGMQGLFFDNEAYFEPYFNYPKDVSYPQKGLAAYQAQFRLRGAQIMRRLRAQWPDIKVFNLHGPYVSEPATPAAVTLQQVGVSSRDMRGYFFAGMLQGAQAPALTIDGGELYQYRTEADFERSVQWRRRGITQVPDSTLVPAAAAARWQQRIGLSFGVYDLQWVPGYNMNPALLEEALYQALLHANAPVWLFTEGAHDYLVPRGIGPRWMDAVARAKQRAQQAMRGR